MILISMNRWNSKYNSTAHKNSISFMSNTFKCHHQNYIFIMDNQGTLYEYDRVQTFDRHAVV